MAFSVLLGAIATTTAAAAQYPIIENPPQWSWSSLGTMAFAHTGQPHAYDATDLQLLKKYSMVQFDKKQDLATLLNDYQEDRFIAAARQIKAVNAKAQVGTWYSCGVHTHTCTNMHTFSMIIVTTMSIDSFCQYVVQ